MDDLLSRFLPDLVGRITGPMSFRLILQPAVATFLAIRAGMADARAGRPLYGWSVATDAGHRVEFLKAGWKDVAKVYTLAIVLDVVYQFIVFRWVYPIQSLVVAFLLAFVPYLLVRGPVNRVMRSRQRREQGHVV
ncbi:MAG TPA: hypothetical protein VM032_19795 [Vicinamibacterales bacterium]|nr:hypothetical protein [Vicinamibacterales bacterium]